MKTELYQNVLNELQYLNFKIYIFERVNKKIVKKNNAEN